jgi:transcriptional regulator with XRE-family HTH domain
MDTNQAVINRLRELCAERNLSMYSLAYISGIHKSTVKNIFNGSSKNTGIITLKKICDGLGISLTEFFDTDVFRTLEQEIK